MNDDRPPSPVLTDKDIDRLTGKTEQVGECTVWTGMRDKDGYGRISWRGRSVRVHRLVWEHLHGPLPAGTILRHTCDNPPCVNPEHLQPGTHKENAEDRERTTVMLRHLDARVSRLEQEMKLMRETLLAKSNGKAVRGLSVNVTDPWGPP